MQIKTAMRYTTSYQSEWLTLKSLQITSAREGVEKREVVAPIDILTYTVGENVNWWNHLGKQY